MYRYFIVCVFLIMYHDFSPTSTKTEYTYAAKTVMSSKTESNTKCTRSHLCFSTLPRQEERCPLIKWAGSYLNLIKSSSTNSLNLNKPNNNNVSNSNNNSESIYNSNSNNTSNNSNNNSSSNSSNNSNSSSSNNSSTNSNSRSNSSNSNNSCSTPANQ